MSAPSNPDDLAFLNEIPDLLQDAPRSASSDVVGSGLEKNATPNAPAQPPRGVAGPTRAQLRARFRLSVLLSLAWMGAHLAVYGVRENLSLLPPTYVLAQIGAPFVIALLSMLVALSPGRLGLGVAVGVTAALALAGPLSFALAVFRVPPPLPVTVGSWVSHLVCLDLTLVWMSVPMLLFAFYLRRAFPTGAGFRSALVGGSCGLFAGSMMNLHCASVEQIHMVLGHAVPVGIGCLVGGLLVSRWLRA
jgi:hypothetical protein